MSIDLHEYRFDQQTIPDLTYPDILKHSAETVEPHRRGWVDIQPLSIEVNAGVFHKVSAYSAFPHVAVAQEGATLVVSCRCIAPKNRLCKHQAEVLCNLIDRPELRIFFDQALRQDKMRLSAIDYGLENEPDLDAYFTVEYAINRFIIKPIRNQLLAFGESGTSAMQAQLFPSKPKLPAPILDGDHARTIIVLRPHKYYHDQFHIELYEAQIAQGGKIKAPFNLVDPNYLIWKTEDIQAAKFYIAIAKFQHTAGVRNIESNLEVLRPIAKNPLKLEAYWHNVALSEKISATALEPVLLQTLPTAIKLTIAQLDNFYEVSGELMAHNRAYPLSSIVLKCTYFVQFGNTLNLIDAPTTLRIIDFMQKHDYKIVLHRSKFGEFRQTILQPLEKLVEIHYPFIPVATKQQLHLQRFDQEKEKIIYLSEEGNFIALTPVMRYGNVEVAVFSRQQIFDVDPRGHEFKVQRDNGEEILFTALIMQQHPDFAEQLHEAEYFYLHKSKFLDENWFLDAFETLRKEGVTILGFNTLKKNKLSMYKGNVSLLVTSDIDWFNVHVKVEFGQQTASLKQLKKTLKNKSNYVQLDDGTLGVLPQDWIEKFNQYFRAGEVFDDLIRSPKNRFAYIHELFEDEVLDQETRNELHFYLDKFANFQGIESVTVPSELNATLRDYQKQGLNWLNFLDDYNFGGCLADDMGLGKTIQVLAFLLLQNKKQSQNVNLVVVPTSLLFNWQAEVAKFAPSLRIFTHHGPLRLESASDIAAHNIILTTYGMMQNDLQLFRQFQFNYIILDESQNIKNPDSQRYKSARLLHSRNKLVLTGTPFENNSFDIYGQLSFACPGLLGSYDNFKFLYSNPIERFDDHRRAMALKKIIQPFILRRTKKQVATELPPKTEMVIYCEMGPQQRAVYNETEKELREYVHKAKANKNKKGTEREAIDTMYVLKGIMKLRQICDAPQLLKGDQILDTPSAKIELLLDQLEQQTPHHKILVFSQFVEMLDLIRKELQLRNIGHTYLTGQTRDRAARVQAFQEDATIRVFLISLKAGGLGLNLTAADYVYLVDPWWNPAVENQAIDRSHRLGQQNHVVAVKLICPDTVEDKIMKLQAAKNRLSDTLIQSDAEILRSLSKEDLLKLLR